MEKILMIRILREVTGTVDGFRYPQNLYYVNEKDQLVWFQVEDYSRGLDKFSKPKRFDMARRKFDLIGTVPELHDDAIVEIKSESGYIHHVNTEKNSCTCKGYKFRGKCKHLAMACLQAA
jgi:hypothetical protein